MQQRCSCFGKTNVEVIENKKQHPHINTDINSLFLSSLYLFNYLFFIFIYLIFIFKFNIFVDMLSLSNFVSDN